MSHSFLELPWIAEGVSPLLLKCLQCVAVCCSVLQCVAVRCSVLPCAAVCVACLYCLNISPLSFNLGVPHS